MVRPGSGARSRGNAHCDSVIPSGLGDALDLHLAIWACFASARIADERRLEAA